MTREQLQAWIERRYGGKVATAARALGVGRGPLSRLLAGDPQNGQEEAIPRHLELAAAAVELGVESYDGGPLHVALGGRPLGGV